MWYAQHKSHLQREIAQSIAQRVRLLTWHIFSLTNSLFLPLKRSSWNWRWNGLLLFSPQVPDTQWCTPPLPSPAWCLRGFPPSLYQPGFTELGRTSCCWDPSISPPFRCCHLRTLKVISSPLLGRYAKPRALCDSLQSPPQVDNWGCLLFYILTLFFKHFNHQRCYQGPILYAICYPL